MSASDISETEAEAEGEPFGKMVDPFGEPVKMAFSLYPWARDAGKGAAYLQSYLDAAFADGIDISSEAGLKQVVERIDLPWDEAKTHLGNDGWQAELESNVQQTLGRIKAVIEQEQQMSQLHPL